MALTEIKVSGQEYTAAGHVVRQYHGVWAVFGNDSGDSDVEPLYKSNDLHSCFMAIADVMSDMDDD